MIGSSLKKFVSNLFKNKWMIVLSVILSAIIWTVVAIIITPEITTTIDNIPVTIDAENSILSQLGFSITTNTSKKTVSVTVSGKRYRVGNLTADDFVAIARPSNIVAAGVYNIPITVELKVNSDEYKVESVSPATVEVNVDAYTDKKFSLADGSMTILVSGNTAAEEGYILDPLNPYTASVSEITVRGPAQEIDQIKSCVLKAENTQKLNMPVAALPATVVFYDENHTQLEFKEANVSPGECTVSIPVFKKKTIPFGLNFINVPEGFNLDSLKYEIKPKELTIASASDLYSTIPDVKLLDVDIRRLNLTSEQIFNVSMRTGEINCDNIEEVRVVFTNEGYTKKELIVRSISIVNLSANYTANLKTPSFRIMLSGPEEELSKITAADIVAKVDLTDARAGTSVFDVSLSLVNHPTVFIVDRQDNKGDFVKYTVSMEVKEIT